MKKIVTLLIAVFLIAFTYAQDSAVPTQISKGKMVMEFNTGMFSMGGLNMMQGSTAMQFTSTDEVNIYNFGFDGGYFLKDGIAVKFGLGYGGLKEKSDWDEDFETNSFSYRLGVKYYLANMYALQVDLTGASIKDLEENPMWLGLQAGYAFFIGDTVAVEPNFRYSLSLNEDFTDEGIVQVNVGLSIFL